VTRVGESPWRCGLEIFGSYQLGASSHDSDIDAVCIVPPTVTREKHFFGELVALLGRNQHVQEVFPIPSAVVPLIKIRFRGVQFDILMSQVSGAMLQLPR
jgi:poly(A) polymerase